MYLAMEQRVLLRLERKWFTTTSTIGRLFINGKPICYTLEDKYRDLSQEPKVYGNTAIPYGTYRILLGTSPKRGYVVPWLVDVPHFTHIQIHPGNFPTNSLGCILPGLQRGQDAVYQSRMAFDKIMEHLDKEKYMEIAIVSGDFSVY